MSKNPLDVLKAGLAKLKKHTKARKDDLLARLRKQEKISSADERWLDTDGNLVDEEAIVDLLENASDFDRGLQRLNSQQKSLVEKLKELGSSIKKATVPGNKRKRPAEHKQKPQAEKQKAQPVFTKKENATLAQRIEILDWHHASAAKNQTKTAAHWDKIYPNLQIKQPLISAWLNEEEKWRAQWAEAGSKGQAGSSKRAKQVEHPAVNEMLELWVTKAMSDGVYVNGEVLRQQWTRFADMEGIPDDERLNLSEGWLTKFKRRCGLQEFRRHGEAGSADPADVERERERLRELIAKYGYRLKDIFNMDETGLFYAMPPDRGLMDKPTSGVKGNKKRLTYALTANADGSEKLVPFIIGKAAKPRAFQKQTGAQLGFYYRNNVKAWMTAKLYQEWLLDWDRKLQQQNRHILLLQDNFSAHIPPEGLKNIRVENFKANLTAHVQPNDAGIIRCFKAHYRSKFISRAIDRYDNDLPPAIIYEIDQLEAMHLADIAWREVDTTTIRNCWRKTGILPDTIFNASEADSTPSIPIASLLNSKPVDVARAEKDVCDSLDQLEQRGVLQSRNRMNIEELLSPVSEQELVGDISEEDIFRAVQDARQAEQMMEINGGDDGDDEGVDEKPTRKDALTAAFTLQRYIADLNEPFARKLEGILASFGRQTRLEASRAMEPTHITDYFTRK
ncbi:putative DDE superfamily endonuclease [Lyophyllum shimeji]|uniref:DDE superfamily endonuclease n=1 Tax=Lyophyllum shimeji TaxID=47721 RepID=A0A9P3PFK5_LYOSH|nr:putative DDE superfamily endonuclease [Lyophyllum shimeji]